MNSDSDPDLPYLFNRRLGALTASLTVTVI
jgi:hypothetical protein